MSYLPSEVLYGSITGRGVAERGAGKREARRARQSGGHWRGTSEQGRRRGVAVCPLRARQWGSAPEELVASRCVPVCVSTTSGTGVMLRRAAPHRATSRHYTRAPPHTRSYVPCRCHTRALLSPNSCSIAN
ncbi:unnamed protein product [Arctia plantaginis]|uniref:Uncharacterized protein n=1 Tax=Arctia plantaginis TaxID=874455 RepID=A0A8S1AW07_ARCPL|nr:unnamed protein product [Arctia plantaginis]